MNTYHVIPTPLVIQPWFEVSGSNDTFFNHCMVGFSTRELKYFCSAHLWCDVQNSTVGFMLIFVPHFLYYLYFLLVLTCFNVHFIIITTTTNKNSYQQQQEEEQEYIQFQDTGFVYGINLEKIHESGT